MTNSWHWSLPLKQNDLTTCFFSRATCMLIAYNTRPSPFGNRVQRVTAPQRRGGINQHKNGFLMLMYDTVKVVVILKRFLKGYI